MSAQRHAILFLPLLLVASPLCAMNPNNQSKKPLRLLLFTAIKNNDTAQATNLLGQGAKLKVKAKKN